MQPHNNSYQHNHLLQEQRFRTSRLHLRSFPDADLSSEINISLKMCWKGVQKPKLEGRIKSVAVRRLAHLRK